MNCEFSSPASGRLWSRQGSRLVGWRAALSLFAVSLVTMLFPAAAARTKHSPSLSAGPDRGYASALAAANRFLQAWQNQDHETGLLLLTDAAKQGSSEERLESFFSGGLDAAYEIGRGKKLKAGRYSFPVTLFTFRSGNRLPRPYPSQIIVVRAGRDEWAIDRLP